MSASKTGENNPLKGVTGENHPKFRIKAVKPPHTIKVSISNIKTKEVLIFESQRDAAKYLGVTHNTVQRALRLSKLINGLYIVKKKINLKN